MNKKDRDSFDPRNAPRDVVEMLRAEAMRLPERERTPSRTGNTPPRPLVPPRAPVTPSRPMTPSHTHGTPSRSGVAPHGHGTPPRPVMPSRTPVPPAAPHHDAAPLGPSRAAEAFGGLAELGGAPLPGGIEPEIPVPSAAPAAPLSPEEIFAQLRTEVDAALGRRAKTVYPQLAKVQKALALFTDDATAGATPFEADQRRAALVAALDKLEDLCEVLQGAR
jgi:hypothetical protein